MSVNKVILLGNLCADPECRYTQAGNVVANIRLATSEKWKKDGIQQEKTEFHNLVAFGRVAEIFQNYTSKGKKVYVEGKITTEKWQDKDGNNRYTTKVVANHIVLLGDGPRKQDHKKESYTDKLSEYDAPPISDDDIPF